MTVLLFLLLLLPQDTSELQIKYDRVSNNTSVSTKSHDVKTGELSVMLFLNYEGTTPTSKNIAGIVFDSYSTDWKFLHEFDQRLHVLADEERFVLANPQRESKVNSSRYSRYVSVSERLVFVITYEQLGLIAKAKSVEMKLGPETFSLGNDTLKAFRQFYTAMGPH